ncbi:hypothetical protein GSI_07946 [Ganoderma sinense ZZ0214-1]|uniref:Methyltransferase domain-containing protein n=1 Tax=Ganoderma sinense ZZ0214-1 TaxID=1077348 RepID=A0A2G8S8G8_9APHY|nr:hypothetical protein GSI_07946 [Ganoderma sinense ZZ0214-1]
MSYVPPESWLCNPLNTSKYLKLDKDERAFFKVTTRLEDDTELDHHILEVQAKAYKIFPYPCIRIFGFTRIRISRPPAYKHFLKLGRERANPIFIDLGCAFGSDLRMAIVDGYPIESCLATDLHGGLYTEGHNLFRDTPDTFPVPFLQGDVLDPAFLAIAEPLPTDSEAIPAESAPSLTGLTSLNPLRGHVSAIYLGKFLHVFDEAGQAHIARALAGLLSPEPGSILFGVQGALEERGPFNPAGSPDWTMFCHSPESLGRLFEDAFGGPGRIRFESRMVEEPGGPTYFDTWPGNKKPFTCQEWSVVRL